MNWMDRWTERFGPEYYGDLTTQVVGTLKQGLAEGLSVPATMYRLEEVLTGPEFNRNRLEIIARTNATTAFNQGRIEMFRQNADFVEFVEYIALLDSRTTAICRARNGKLMKLDSTELAGNTPPLHYRCRSILSPVSRYGVEDMQVPGWKDPDGNTLPQKGFGSVGKALENRTDNSPEKEGAHNKIEKRGRMDEEKSAIVGKIFAKKKIHIPINVLKESEADVSKVFRNDLALLESHIREVNFSRFPTKLLEFLTENDDYNVTIVSSVKKTDPIGRIVTERNRPGSYNRETKILQISTWALDMDSGHFEEEITHLLDHILGSNCQELMGTLSSGIGITPNIEEFGKEIHSLFVKFGRTLGDDASKNSREFLAESVKAYFIYPDLLQSEVPEVYNIIDKKFLNNDFWKAIL